MNRIARATLAGAALTSLAGGAVVAGTGAANAQTTTPHQPTTPHARHVTTAHTRKRSAAHRQRVTAPVSSLGSTIGFNLYNYSAETLDYVKTTGSLPAPPTAPITAGHRVNFELPQPVFSSDKGSAYYNVMSADGTQIGTMELDLTDPNGNGNDIWSVTYKDMDGNTLKTMTTSGNPINNDGIYVEDTVGSDASTQVLTAGSDAEQTILDSVCQTVSSACTFDATSETKSYSAPKLLAQGYNGSSEDSEITANNGYTDSTTDTWGAAITAESELGPIKASVQANYSHAVSESTDFSTSYQGAVSPGDTGYVSVEVPQYVDSGTMTIHLGNTTWTLPGITVDSAIPGGTLMYEYSQVTGNVPQPLDPGAHTS